MLQSHSGTPDSSTAYHRLPPHQGKPQCPTQCHPERTPAGAGTTAQPPAITVDVKEQESRTLLHTDSPLTVTMGETPSTIISLIQQGKLLDNAHTINTDS